MPEVQQKIEAQGGEVRIGSPEDFSAWMKANIASWGAVVREANIKVE